MSTAPTPTDTALLDELRQLIEQAREHVTQTASSTLTMLYWQMGARIQREALKDGRADYGERIVSTLSTQLVREYYAEMYRIERWRARTLRGCNDKITAICSYSIQTKTQRRINQPERHAGLVDSMGLQSPPI